MSEDYKFDPQWKGDPAPLDYKGTLPFDRFGPNGHRHYHKNHSGKYGHFCAEWDYLWICNDCKEFQACKCFDYLTPEDEIWFRDILPHLIEVEELCAANKFEFEWAAKMPHIDLSGKVNSDSTVIHKNSEE